MTKQRVYTKAEIKEAFEEYLRETNLIETYAWDGLSVEDMNVLQDRHFGIFYRELKRWSVKRKIEL